jgi:hypothetical protein
MNQKKRFEKDCSATPPCSRRKRTEYHKLGKRERKRERKNKVGFGK